MLVGTPALELFFAGLREPSRPCCGLCISFAASLFTTLPSYAVMYCYTEYFKMLEL